MYYVYTGVSSAVEVLGRYSTCLAMCSGLVAARRNCRRTAGNRVRPGGESHLVAGHDAEYHHIQMRQRWLH